LARRLYFIEEKEQVRKREISSIFDAKFKNISKRVSLVELSKYLDKDLKKLDLEKLVQIISKCNKFILLTRKYALRKFS